MNILSLLDIFIFFILIVTFLIVHFIEIVTALIFIFFQNQKFCFKIDRIRVNILNISKK